MEYNFVVVAGMVAGIAYWFLKKGSGYPGSMATKPETFKEYFTTHIERATMASEQSTQGNEYYEGTNPPEPIIYRDEEVGEINKAGGSQQLHENIAVLSNNNSVLRDYMGENSVRSDSTNSFYTRFRNHYPPSLRYAWDM